MPNKCTERSHYDGKEHESFYVCSICECPLGTHCFYVHCPLLEDELICIDCCQNDVQQAEILKTFKDIGVEITREKIEETCKGCGNRCLLTDKSILPSEVKESHDNK
jgi:hypothetical protein